MNKEHFSCRCEDNQHQFIVRKWYWDDGDPELSISIMMDHYLNFYQRIWVAIRYVFGVTSQDHFSEILITKEDRARLIKILEVEKD